MKITKKRGYILIESENRECIPGFDCVDCVAVKIVKIKNHYTCQVTVWNKSNQAFWYTENWNYAKNMVNDLITNNPSIVAEY